MRCQMRADCNSLNVPVLRVTKMRQKCNNLHTRANQFRMFAAKWRLTPSLLTLKDRVPVFLNVRVNISILVHADSDV